MFRRVLYLRASCIAALAVLVVGASPAAAAGWIRLRNDTPVPLIIQGASANNPNRKVNQKLFPRESNGFPSVQPGAKIIGIYNQQLQLLNQVTVTVGQDDLFFSIQVQGGKVVLQPSAK